MAWVTHNIVCPTSWSVYDMVDRRLPKQRFIYPDPDSPVAQPTTFYCIGYDNFQLGVGTLTSTLIYVKDLAYRNNVLEIIQDIIDSGEVYAGPTTVTPTRATQVLETVGYVMGSNIIVNPIPSNYGLVTQIAGHRLRIE